MSPVIPLIGYAPDADPTAPGVVTDCSSLVPTLRGMRSAPTPVAPIGVTALPTEVRGGAATTNTVGGRTIFAGTQTKLYRMVASTWTDVSRSGDYVGTGKSRWMFAQFGDACVATNDTETMQASVGGSSFADIAGAPVARIAVASANFVLAFDTDEATYGDQSDRWWCSAYQDHSSWTPSVTTQATTGRLIGSGGELTAAAALGQFVVAYKMRSVFLGTYVGAPVVWQWDRIPGDVGCAGPEAIVDIGGAHIFAGEDNIYMFDGGRVVPLADGAVREWWLANSSAQFRFRTIMVADLRAGLVWMWFPSATSSTGRPDMCLVMHLTTKKWGRADSVVEAAFGYINEAATYNSLSDAYDAQPSEPIDDLIGTYDAHLGIPWDSPYWLASARMPAVFNTDHQLQLVAGNARPASMITGDMGDDSRATMLRRARLRFLVEPTSATAVGFTKSGEGGRLSTGSTAAMNDSGFDIRQSGRWHRLRFDFTGPAEVTGISIDAIAAGMK